MTIDPTVHDKLDEIRVVLEAILTELRKKRQLPDEVTQHIPTPPPDYVPPSYLKWIGGKR